MTYKVRYNYKINSINIILAYKLMLNNNTYS